jgi:8-oxo-dGTP diphosphatase
MKRTTSIPLAVSLIILKDAHTALGISRRNDFTQWGFPGGKIDPGEDPVAAICRETFEETGLVVEPWNLVVLYGGHVKVDVPYWTTLFLYLGPAPELPDLLPEEGMKLKWMALPEFCLKSVSPFASYNRRALPFLEEYLVPPPEVLSALPAPLV